MVFNGIEAIQQLAADVGAKSFVIHEKGIKSRALRQRSVGTTNKVKSELGKFANVPEYQNGQYFVMFFDEENVPRSSREANACATAEFSLGSLPTTTTAVEYQQPVVSGLSIGEIEQRAGQIAENTILRYKIEQKDKEIKDLEKEIDEPSVDYTQTILGALSGILGQKPAADSKAVNGIITPDTDIVSVNGTSEQDSIKASLKKLQTILGSEKKLAEKLHKLAARVEKNPVLIDLL